MKQKAIVIALGSLLAASTAYADIDLMGKEVQIYGKLHVSADYYSLGRSVVGNTDPKGTEITSNSSRIGFKGTKELRDDLSAVWMFESELDWSGETTEIKSRNRYLGLAGSWGTVKVGLHDTPFKDVGNDYTMFGDTIGDRRSILGVTSAHANLFNVRAKNMVKYEIGAGDFSGGLMYSPDFDNKNSPDGSNGTTADDTLVSLGGSYKFGDLDVAASYEQQNGIGGVKDADASGFRLGAKYKIDALKIGGIYESLSDDGYGAIIERDAYGVNASYKIEDFTLAGQYLVADASNVAGGNDGADQYTLGVYYDIAKSAQVYAAYSSTNNDTNATYGLAQSGHGTVYNATKAGETVWATSVGMVYSF